MIREEKERGIAVEERRESIYVSAVGARKRGEKRREREEREEREVARDTEISGVWCAVGVRAHSVMLVDGRRSIEQTRPRPNPPSRR